jgi:murein L,D-transpeptidase YafK
VEFRRAFLAALLAAAVGGPAWATPEAARWNPAAVDRIVVFKHERRLELQRDGQTLKSYRVALGFNPTGHKLRQGDGRTPEGTYVIEGRNPNSRFHLSLRVSYPDAIDAARAQAVAASPGGDIMIHGVGREPRGRALHPRRDWTEGCIAVSDKEIEEIWASVPDGTPIEIRP